MCAQIKQERHMYDPMLGGPPGPRPPPKLD
jgi:hypothetical protein